jgi:hypothetical protein
LCAGIVERPKWLQLEIEKQGILKYGWEPDGSRMTWKLDGTTDPQYVDVQRMDIGIEIF